MDAKDSEYSRALGYAPWLKKHQRLKVLVAQMFGKMRHASVVLQILKGLGQDIESHIEKSLL